MGKHGISESKARDAEQRAVVAVVTMLSDKGSKGLAVPLPQVFDCATKALPPALRTEGKDVRDGDGRVLAVAVSKSAAKVARRALAVNGAQQEVVSKAFFEQCGGTVPVTDGIVRTILVHPR